MKKYLLILFITVLITYSYAQTNVVYQEEFNDNSTWYIGGDNEAKSSITNGVYSLRHFNNEGNWYWYNNCYFDPYSDFIIEMSIKNTGGTNNQGFGYVLIDKRFYEKPFYNYFIISGNQFFKIYQWDSNLQKQENFREWTEVPDIVKPTNEYNKLVIKKSGTLTEFYINDVKVYEHENLVFWGTELGIVLNGTIDVDVDYISVKQDVKPINLIKGNNQIFAKENLGTNVNTQYSEAGPVISYDGQTLYFFRKNHPANTGGLENDDVWYSTLQEDNSWSVAKNIGVPINNTAHNFIISATPDGNSLLIANTYNPDGSSKSSGISMAKKGISGWDVPSTVSIINQYNNNQYVNYCLSPDMKVLISAVERNDSYGEMDLYVSFLNSDNEFSEPVNMGKTLNTYTSDIAPFLAADNKTLYFSSSGFPGYGSNDIYLSRRLDDTWLNWSEPENLGSDINSAGWEAYYTIPAKGDYAYLSSNSDLYKIKVSEAAKPAPVLLIFGKVLNSKTNEPLSAKITYFDLETNVEIGIANSDPATGNYKIILPAGKKYGFLATKDNFYSISQNIDGLTIVEYAEIEKNLYLAPLEVGQTIRLNNIFFETNKSELLPVSASEIDRLISLLQEMPNLVIEIAGHTDNVGTDEYNQNLSMLRATSVLTYITAKGIATKRLKSVGYGENIPVKTNETVEGREMNRRVEFKIISK